MPKAQTSLKGEKIFSSMDSVHGENDGENSGGGAWGSCITRGNAPMAIHLMGSLSVVCSR